MLLAMGSGHRTETVERARRALLEDLRRARGDEPMGSVAHRALGRGRQWLQKVEVGELDVSLADFIALCEALGLMVQLTRDPRHLEREIRTLGRRVAGGNGARREDITFAIRMLRSIARELDGHAPSSRSRVSR